jgi:hypothetical protein
VRRAPAIPRPRASAPAPVDRAACRQGPTRDSARRSRRRVALGGPTSPDAPSPPRGKDATPPATRTDAEDPRAYYVRPRPFPSSRVHEALVRPFLPSLKLPHAINGALNPSAALYSPFPGDLSPPLPLSIKAQPSPCPSHCPSSLLVLALSRVRAAPQPPRPDHLDGAPPAVKPLPTRCPARHRTVRIHLLFTGAPPVLARRRSPPRHPWTRWSSCLPSTQHPGWTSRMFPTRQDHRTHRPSSRHMSENLRLKTTPTR